VSEARYVTLEHWHRGKVGARGREEFLIVRKTATQLIFKMGGYTVRMRLKDGFPVGVGPKDRETVECWRIPVDELEKVKKWS
jgi:hypothetical protein